MTISWTATARFLHANSLGIASFIGFLACVPLANWMIGHAGTVCVPNGPCLIPVAPSLFGFPALMAPSGVLMVGFALVLRDLVQRSFGTMTGLVAVLIGTAASSLVAPTELVIASGVAFLLSELADFAVYTPLQRRGLVLAVVASSAVGLVVDSFVFLSLAFHNLDFIAGQIVGKAWAVALSIPLVRMVRRLTPISG